MIETLIHQNHEKKNVIVKYMSKKQLKNDIFYKSIIKKIFFNKKHNEKVERNNS